MKQRFTLISVVIIAVLSTCFIGCSSSEPKSITAFCGSASKPPLEEAAKSFFERTGMRVNLTFGGSGGVLSQMKLAKEGDLYIPGSPDYIVIAERDGVIEQGSAQLVAYLIPAIVVQSGNPKKIKTLADLAKPGVTVGIGNPESVCVGLYAVEILVHNNLLESVGKNIVTYAESCDKTASIVALKAVDAVLGWEVFSAWNPGSMETIFLAPEQIPRIAYIPVSLSKFARDKETAKQFAGFLTSMEGKKIFSRWGYLTSESEARKYSPNALIGGEYKLPSNYRSLVK